MTDAEFLRDFVVNSFVSEIDAPGNYIARQDGAGNWWRVNLDGSLVKLGSVP